MADFAGQLDQLKLEISTIKNELGQMKLSISGAEAQILAAVESSSKKLENLIGKGGGSPAKTPKTIGGSADGVSSPTPTAISNPSKVAYSSGKIMLTNIVPLCMVDMDTKGCVDDPDRSEVWEWISELKHDDTPLLDYLKNFHATELQAKQSEPVKYNKLLGEKIFSYMKDRPELKKKLDAYRKGEITVQLPLAADTSSVPPALAGVVPPPSIVIE